MIVWQAACIDFARVSAAALGPDPSPDGTGALFQRLSPQWSVFLRVQVVPSDAHTTIQVSPSTATWVPSVALPRRNITVT